MFAGISTVLFAAVVIIPFIYGLYLTFTSWDGISKDKQFVGFANYIATFKDIAYWQALGRTVIYSVHFRCSGKCGCIFPSIFAD